MIRVCCSNRTETLLAAFVRNLSDERQAAGPLVPVRVVVPNRNVETYLRLGVARACGIAANLHITFLRRLLAHVAQQALPGARVVDARQIESHLLALFHDEPFLAAPVLAPLRDYLHAGGDQRDAIDRRRCQLATQLGPLFEEYAVSRTEMVEAWRTGSKFDRDPVFATTEAWQRALWLAIFGPDGRVARRSQSEGQAWLRIDEMLATAEAQGALVAEALGPRLHLFGASYVAPAFHRMLGLLGRHIDVVFYTLNPCRESWQELQARKALSARARPDDPFALLDDSPNLPVRLWGRPGRENLRLLGLLPACALEDHFAPAQASTLLGRLQNDILDRVGGHAPDPSLRADGSIQVLACPGVRRELEVVAAEIWRCLRADQSLRCNDIAVIVPESRKNAYLSQVSAVFGESHDLPHHMVDLPLQSGHRLGTAIELLLNLPFSPFSRKELAPLLTHPAVMRRFPQARASDWLRLVDELGIVRGADRRDVEGSYLDRDLFTWEQGLRRLALGAFMSGAGCDGQAAVALGEDQVVPVELAPDERTEALGLALLVRSLIADARFAAGIDAPAERPLAEWLDFIRGMLAAYLVAEDDVEEALLARCRAALDELEDGGLRDLPIRYRVAAELASRALLAIPGSRGQYLARGVTVASFVPMRAIPFRVVFVLGLGQGDFPRGNRRGDLDLREARREPGDVTPREQDLYMFLETLLCARDRLVLCYVGRDEVTGVAQPPSPLLLELREILASGYLAPVEVDKLFEDASTRPPLRRYHDDERLPALPLAAAERAALKLGASLRAAAPAAAPASVADLRNALSPAAFAEVADRLSLPAPAPLHARPRAPDAPLIVSLHDLRRFLEDPLQASASFRLRLAEPIGDDELADQEDEPFARDALNRAGILREAMVRATLASPAAPSFEAVAACYDEISRREELAGHGPAGLFREAERESHAVILNQWCEQLGRIAGNRPLQGRVVHFGQAAQGEDVREILPAIRLDIEVGRERLRVDVQGRTNVLALEQPRSSLIFSCRSPDKREPVRRDKELLRAFLDHVALAAAGLPAGENGHRGLLLLAQPDKRDPVERRFAPLEAGRARAYLGALLRDLVTGTRDQAGQPTGLHAYVLPCEAVFLGRRAGLPLLEAVEQIRGARDETSRDQFSTLHGPIRDAAWRWNPPTAEEAARMVEGRFGLYFELLGAE